MSPVNVVSTFTQLFSAGLTETVAKDKNEIQARPYNIVSKPVNYTIAYMANVKTRGTNLQHRGCNITGCRFSGYRPPDNIKIMPLSAQKSGILWILKCIWNKGQLFGQVGQPRNENN